MLTWVELCNDLNNGLFYFVFQEFVQSLGPVIFLKQKKIISLWCTLFELWVDSRNEVI